MFRFIFTITVLLVTSLPSFAVTDEEEGWNEYTIKKEDFEHPDAPRFEQHKVSDIPLTKPVPVNIASHPEAKTWRTQLMGAGKEPNFSGHMQVITWGCGTDCMSMALVDRRNGQIFLPDNFRYNVFVNIHYDAFDRSLEFHRDSNLLIVAGCLNGDCSSRRGVHYFLWTGKELKEI